LFAIQRDDFVRTLFEGLSEEEQARYHLGKTLARIETTGTGVAVTCEDGSVYNGSIVVGADGAHSETRTLMRDLARAAVKGTSPHPFGSNAELVAGADAGSNPENPYKAEYRLLWCSFPRQPSLALGDGWVAHGEGGSLQSLITPTRSNIFIYERIPEEEITVRGHGRRRYTEKEVDDFAKRWGHLPIGPTLRIKDIYPMRFSSGLTNINEGLTPHWSWGGRVVLVGDACHTMTPNQGIGCINGIQDAATLVNGLRALLSSGTNGIREPSAVQLQEVFHQYQDAREDPLKVDFETTATQTRMAAWETWKYWLLDRHILTWMPMFDDVLVSWAGWKHFRKAPVLDFVEGEETMHGRITWVNKIPAPGSMDRR